MQDPYTNSSVCVERLLKEYKKHGKLILAVDFDDTVYPYHGTTDTHIRTLSLVKAAQDIGFYIVGWTASSPVRYPMINQYFARHGIILDSINKNPIDLPFGNNGKIYYNLLLDDRAGLGQACDILDAVLAHIRQNPISSVLAEKKQNITYEYKHMD